MAHQMVAIGAGVKQVSRQAPVTRQYAFAFDQVQVRVAQRCMNPAKNAAELAVDLRHPVGRGKEVFGIGKIVMSTIGFEADFFRSSLTRPRVRCSNSSLETDPRMLTPSSSVAKSQSSQLARKRLVSGSQAHDPHRPLLYTSARIWRAAWWHSAGGTIGDRGSVGKPAQAGFLIRAWRPNRLSRRFDAVIDDRGAAHANPPQVRCKKPVLKGAGAHLAQQRRSGEL